MRLIPSLLILVVIALGALFGAINGMRVPLDLYFVEIQAPLGVSLLCAMLAGWLLGGLVAWLGQRSLRRRQPADRDERQAPRAQTPSGGAQDPG